MNDARWLLRAERMVPMDDLAPSGADAVILAGGRIERIGRYTVLDEIAGDCPRVMLADATILPAFIDPHTHLEATAVSLHGVTDVRSPPCHTVDDILAHLDAGLRAGHVRDGWLLAQGNILQELRLQDGRLPSPADLDRVSLTVPIAVRFGVHVTVCNEAAWRRISARVRRDASVGRLPGVGAAAGVLREGHHLLPIPGLSRADLREALRRTIADLWVRNGVTWIGEISESDAGWEVLSELSRDGDLGATIAYYLWTPAVVPEAMVAGRIAAGHRQRLDDLYVAGVKRFVDGGISAQRAAFSRPYRDGRRTAPAMTADDIAAALHQSSNLNTDLLLHTVGDTALEAVWAGWERLAARSEGVPLVRLEHAGNYAPDTRQVAMQAARFGARVLCQPGFVFAVSRAFRHYLGESAMPHLFPFASLLGAGVRLAASSDTSGSDLEIIRPLFGMWCARARADMREQPVAPEERIGVMDALRLYTTYAAEAAGVAADRGSLTEGKVADLVVLPGRIEAWSDASLKEMRPIAVIRRGRVAYADQQSAGFPLTRVQDGRA